MKTIRELLSFIPDHILDMDLSQTFLMGFDLTDVQVQFDRLMEIGVVDQGSILPDDCARKVLDVMVEKFDPEVGFNDGLVRMTILGLMASKEIDLA